MLTVTIDNTQKKLNISSAYLYAKRIRNLPTAVFNRDLKVWQINKEYVDELCKQFAGEIYFKTPLWYIKEEPTPDYSEMYKIDEKIQCPDLKIPPYVYQKYGVRFMIDRILKYGFVINADGVGIGKTLQGIGTMQWFKENKGFKKYLLIVKKSIKEQWAEEIHKFSTLGDTHEIIFTEDTKKKREKAYNLASEKENVILITNYHNFLNDTDLINNIDFDMVLIDEAHCVKAHDGVLNNNISKVVNKRPTIFLTGTPIMSRPEDIFGIIQMARSDYFGDWKTFSAYHLVTEFNYGYTRVVGAKHLDELRDKVQNIVIRRTEYEISIEMPDTIEKNLYVDCSDIQKQLLKKIKEDEALLKEAYDKITKFSENKVKSEKEKEQLLSITNKMKGMISLKQAAATDPRIFFFAKSKTMQYYAKNLPKNIKKSPKTELIVDTVDEILNAGEKVILFSKFVTIGKFFKDEIEKGLKQKVLMYTGEEGSEERHQNISTFRTSDEHNILIGSDAMAEGLNLAEARHVINLDLPDTFAIYTQRLGRSRRVSSKYEKIFVYNVLSKNTVDETKLQKLKKDQELDGALIAADSAQAAALKGASLNE